MAGAKTAFLSHKVTDGDLAVKCQKALRDLLNIKVFMSEDIPKGTNWREDIHSAINKADCFILLFTDPIEDWSWCLYEAGLYGRSSPQANGSRRRPIYCLHFRNTPPPSPLADLQTVRADVDEIQKFINNLYETFKYPLPRYERIQAAARRIEQAFKGIDVLSEVDIKPYVWVIPEWPNRSKPNFNAAKLPAIRFENALVEVDRDSAAMLGFGTPPRNYTLKQFLNILDTDASQYSHRPSLWMNNFFQSLMRGVSADLKMQEIAFFRHEEGVVLRPIVVSVAKNQDATTCRLKVRFSRTVAPPAVDQPDPVQRLADGVRLGVRTRIEVIEAFSGRMSQIYHDKVLSDSPMEEVGRNFTVRMIKALQAIRDEAMAHGFNPKAPPPRLFADQAEQRRYQNIRDRGILLWDELAKAATKEDQEGRGRYVETERLLAELRKMNDEYLKVALPRLDALLRTSRLNPISARAFVKRRASKAARAA